MKKILFSFFCFFVVQNIHACPNLLNSDMRILDSAETQNLCAYEGTLSEWQRHATLPSLLSQEKCSMYMWRGKKLDIAGSGKITSTRGISIQRAKTSGYM